MKTATEILKDLVALESANPPGNEETVCQYIETYFHDLRLPVILQEVMAGRRNLLARLPGRSALPLVFTGHMDVVPVSPAEGSRWRTDPFSAVLKAGRLYGRGATDMKAGLAAAMTAMARLREQGITPPHDILLCATVDEEFLMRGSAAIMAGGLIPRAAGILVCEPTGLEVCTASRGRTFGRITFSGHTGHGSDPSSSLNALDLAHHFMSEMKKVRFRGTDGTFWQALSIHAGVEPGVIPDQCVLGIDARLGLDHQPASIWSRVDAILEDMAQKYPGMSSQITIDDDREPWQTDEADPFLLGLIIAWQGCGHTPTFDIFPGTTDGTKLRRNGAACLIAGPGDLALAHRENESVDLAQVDEAVDLYAHLMAHFKTALEDTP